MGRLPQALNDVRIAEFGAYAAGPHIGKMLANFGATVVHVESKKRPDGFRLEYPPYKDGKLGIDRGACFAYFNDSKYGVTLDLKSDAGIALAKRLIAWSDIVIENMRPNVMARLGLGFEDAIALNPRIVMLSTCNMGQTGPRADTPGFGSQLSALAGFCGLTGDADGPPNLLYGPYIDFIASSMGAAAVLAALERARASGEPTWIDVSQYETGLHFMAGALFDYHQNGRVAERTGNRDAEAAPHNAYPCRNGTWLSLSCWSDEEFAHLAGAIGMAALASDARFATSAARRENEAALDASIASWTRNQTAEHAATVLQKAGVHAYAVNTMEALFADPQLASRRLWRRRRHAVLGDQTYVMPGFDLSEVPGDVTAPAPLLGADNEAVFRDILGLSAAEYAECAARGAFE